MEVFVHCSILGTQDNSWHTVALKNEFSPTKVYSPSTLCGLALW